MPRMSDARLVEIRKIRVQQFDYASLLEDELLDTLITERKMVKWLAQSLADPLRWLLSRSEDEWIHAAEQAVGGRNE